MKFQISLYPEQRVFLSHFEDCAVKIPSRFLNKFPRLISRIPFLCSRQRSRGSLMGMPRKPESSPTELKLCRFAWTFTWPVSSSFHGPALIFAAANNDPLTYIQVCWSWFTRCFSPFTSFSVVASPRSQTLMCVLAAPRPGQECFSGISWKARERFLSEISSMKTSCTFPGCWWSGSDLPRE